MVVKNVNNIICLAYYILILKLIYEMKLIKKFKENNKVYIK